MAPSAARAATAAALACPVCYDVPPEEVRQCVNGHCVCARCWERIRSRPRPCPECRVEMPEPIRSRAQELRIREFKAQQYTARTTRLADAEAANARLWAENEQKQAEIGRLKSGNERLRARNEELVEEERGTARAAARV